MIAIQENTFSVFLSSLIVAGKCMDPKGSTTLPDSAYSLGEDSFYIGHQADDGCIKPVFFTKDKEPDNFSAMDDFFVASFSNRALKTKSYYWYRMGVRKKSIIITVLEVHQDGKQQLWSFSYDFDNERWTDDAQPSARLMLVKDVGVAHDEKKIIIR